jgi:DNA-binding response OmpR family regulator
MSNQSTLAGDSRPLRVLLVDDHADTAELLRMLLVRRGFEVTTARSVATALVAAESTPIDVLVSDIGLSDGTGCDLLRQIRAVRPLPAIALSGRDREADVQSARDAGFDEYLGKPVGIVQLVEALRRVAAK